MKLIYLLIAMSLITPNATIAECVDDKGTTSSLYGNCYQPSLEESEKDLQKQFKKTEQLLNSHYRTKGTIASDWLKNSQEAWGRYQYLFCVVESIAAIGPQSSRVSHTVECKISSNIKRMEELNNISKFLSP